MSINVEIPEHGTVVTFPDGTTPEEIQEILDRDFPIEKQGLLEKAKGFITNKLSPPAQDVQQNEPASSTIFGGALYPEDIKATSLNEALTRPDLVEAPTSKPYIKDGKKYNAAGIMTGPAEPWDADTFIKNDLPNIAKTAPERFATLSAKTLGGAERFLGEDTSGDPESSIYGFTSAEKRPGFGILGDPEALAAEGTAITSGAVEREAELDTSNPVKTKAGKILQGAITSISQQLPGLALTPLTGGSSVALSLMGIQSFFLKYAEDRDKGMAPDDAAANATVQGITEPYTEKLGLDRFVKGMQSGWSTKVIRDYLLREQMGEHVATAVENSFDVAFAEKDPSKRADAAIDYLKSHKHLEDQKDTFWQTLTQTLLMSSAGKLINKTTGVKELPSKQEEEYDKYVEQKASAAMYENMFGKPAPIQPTKPEWLNEEKKPFLPSFSPKGVDARRKVTIPDTGITDPNVTVEDAIAAANAEVDVPIGDESFAGIVKNLGITDEEIDGTVPSSPSLPVEQEVNTPAVSSDQPGVVTPTIEQEVKDEDGVAGLPGVQAASKGAVVVPDLQDTQNIKRLEPTERGITPSTLTASGQPFSHQADIHAEELAAKLEAGGITPDDPLHTEVVGERRQRERAPDATTGLIAREHHYPTLERAWKDHQSTGRGFSYASIDIANLGGLNNFAGGESQANVHVAAIAKIIQSQIAQDHLGAQVFRRGGDEFAVIAPDVPQTELDESLAKAKKSVTLYAEKEGLTDIPHKTSGKPPGVGIEYGVADFKENSTVKDVEQVADSAMMQKRAEKGADYVRGKYPEKTGSIAPQGQAGGIEKGISRESEADQVTPSDKTRDILTGLNTSKLKRGVQLSSLKELYGKDELNRLAKDGLIAFPGGGIVELTKKGKEWLQSNPLPRTATQQTRFEFLSRKKKKTPKDEKNLAELAAMGEPAKVVVEAPAGNDSLTTDRTNLTPSLRRSLEDVRNEIEQGKAGSRGASLDKHGDMHGFKESSTFPEYFKNKGYTKKEAIAAIDKALSGGKLTPKQSAMVSDLNNGRRTEIADYVRKERAADFKAKAESFGAYDPQKLSDVLLDVFDYYNIEDYDALKGYFQEAEHEVQRILAGEAENPVAERPVESNPDSKRKTLGDANPETVKAATGIINTLLKLKVSRGDAFSRYESLRSKSNDSLTEQSFKQLFDEADAKRKGGSVKNLDMGIEAAARKEESSQEDLFGGDDPYEVASQEVDRIYPSIIDLKKPEANHIVMDIQTMHGGAGKKIAAPYDGTKADALRVAKLLKLHAAEELNASMQGSAVFATGEDAHPIYAFTQGEGVTVMHAIPAKEPVKQVVDNSMAITEEEYAPSPRNKQKQELNKDKTYRKLLKESGDYHPESGAAAQFAGGYLDFKEGVAPNKNLKPTAKGLREGGFNPVDAYMNGYLSAKTGKGHSLRSLESIPYYETPDFTPSKVAEGDSKGKEPEKLYAGLTKAEYRKKVMGEGYSYDITNDKLIPPGEVASHAKTETPEGKAPKTLQQAIDRFDSDEDYTPFDFANDVERLADTPEIEKAVDDYRKAEEYDRSVKGRGDMDEAADKLISAVQKAVKPLFKMAKKSKDLGGKAEVSAVDGKIDDFGEKLGGAKKDRQASIEREFTDDEIANKTLSEIWPKSEIEAIEDKQVAAFSTAARAEIPSKPRKGYKLDAWVGKVKDIRGLVQHFQAMGADAFYEKAVTDHPILKSFIAKAKLLEQLDRDQWGRIGKLNEHPNAYRYGEGTERIPSPFTEIEIDGKAKQYKVGSAEEALPQIQEALGLEPEESKMQFEVRGRGDRWFINKKGDPLYRPLKTFTDSKEAVSFVRDKTNPDLQKQNYNELVAAWDAIKERENVKERDLRTDDNRPRAGADYRGGKDVTPEMFVRDLGFRGVEFGNWVSQGKADKERQGMLNAAYDALMDLSNILGVPPKAISLNGTLGLGFGSRGSGWASAHYEPGSLIINLTKTRGAGALAHEFFHALDHYFQNLRGDRTGWDREQTYITYAPENYYKDPSTGHRLSEERFNQLKDRKAIRNPDNWKMIEGVRLEVAEAFTDLVKALNDSPMSKRSDLIDKGKSGGYWSRVIERAARAFENYVMFKMQQDGYHNDYLANVVNEHDFRRDPERYPYLLESEVAPVAQAFDNLFSTIKTKETESGTALFSIAGQRPSVANAQAIEYINNLNDHFAGKYGDQWSNAYELATDPQPTFTDALRRTFGVEVLPIRSLSAEGNRLEGVAWRGRIFVNVGSNVGFVRIAGHELLHAIKQQSPSLYQFFRENAEPYIINQSRYKQSLEAVAYKKITDEAVTEEILADFTSDAIVDPAFLTQLAEKNISKFRLFIRSVVDWFLNLADKMKQENLESSQYFTDVSAVRNYLAKVLDAFSKNHDVSKITDIESPMMGTKFSDKGQKSGLLNVIVKKKLSPLINRLKDAYSVEVIQSERELRPELQAQVRSENVEGKVEGLFDPEHGKVILIADNLKDLTRAEEVLKHELVHKGISKVFGNRLNIYLDMIKSERKLSSRRAAEEFIAEHGEQYAGQGSVKRFIAAARQMLRDMGFKVKFSDADILSIAGKSIEATEKGAVGIHSAGVRFAAAWHGSPHDFDKFQSHAIGTGEGVQAYGHGLYMASSRDVAEYYRESTSGRGRGGLTLAGAMPTSPNEGLSDDAWSAAKNLSKLLVTDSGVIQSLGSLDVVKQGRVLSMMHTLLEDSKVLDTVVSSIPVDVVNVLAGKEYTPKYLLDNPTMLIYLFPRNANDLVASKIPAVDKLAFNVALAAAKVHTGLTRFDVSPSDFLTADGTIHKDLPNDVASKIPLPSEFVKGRLYQVELAPSEDEYLLWDKPLSEQSEKVKAALKTQGTGIDSYDFDFLQRGLKPYTNPETNKTTEPVGGAIYRDVVSLFSRENNDKAGVKAASEYLHSLGIRGIKYLDGTSRNRPIKDIKKAFLDALPEDAEFDDVTDMIGTGTFSPEQEALLKALEKDDWLGFDYPAQAISAALGNNLSGYDASKELKDAVAELAKDQTFNYVLFDENDVSITAKFSLKDKAQSVKKFTSSSTKVQQRRDAAHGLAKGPGLLDRLKETLNRFWKETQHFPELNMGKDAQTADILRVFEASRQAATAKTVAYLKQLTGDMTSEQMNNFEWRVLLDDLMEESAKGHSLPFGYTPETLETDHARIVSLTESDEKIKAAIESRQKTQHAIVKELVEKGMLPETVLESKAYFRHMVLEYANAKKWAGLGNSDLRNKKRGWQKGREGSELDINTNFLEAEFEVYSQQLKEIATKDALDKVEAINNIGPKLKRQARATNFENLVGGAENVKRIRQLESESATQELDELDPTRPFKKKMAIGFSRLQKLAENGDLPEGKLKGMAEALASGEPTEKLFNYIAYLAGGDSNGALPSRMILKAVADMDKLYRETLGKKYLEYRRGIDERLIPEGYVEWQPEIGNVFHKETTLPEQIINKAIESTWSVEELIASGLLQQQTVMMGKKRSIVIPEGVALTLDNLRFERDTAVLDNINKKMIGAWKIWTLLSPRRVFKYNLNNMSGDADAAIAADPKILPYMKEAWTNALNRRKGNLSELDIDMLDRGVIDSGISINEIPDISQLPIFKDLTEEQRKGRLWDAIRTGDLSGLAPNAIIARYFDKISQLTNIREGLLREAAYRRALELLSQGKEISWASNPAELAAIPDNKDKAAKLARELVGDYGNLSAHGERIRARYIPFWSWCEINTPRYYRIFRNAMIEGGKYSTGARIIGVSGKKVIGTTIGAVEKVILTQMLFALVSAFNYLVHGDDDDELDMKQLHIILGKDSDGKVLSLRFQGAFSDALSWFGLEDYPKTLKKLDDGSMSAGDLARKIAMATPNRLVNSALPFVKLAAETMVKKTIYPDMTKPRVVRDRGEHVARFLSLDAEYRAIAGKPTKGYADSLKGILFYTSDPKEQAYNDIRARAIGWMEKQGKEMPGGEPTERSNALYYFKQAKRFGDEEAEAKYKALYKELGGKHQGMMTSIKNAAPLHMTGKYSAKFKESLSPAELKKLELATEFYKEVYWKN